MKYQAVLILIFAYACASDEGPVDSIDNNIDMPVYESTTSRITETLSEIWVCHHPNTKMHGQPCIEDTYPAGCFVPGDTSKFCWILTEQDCSGEQDLSWQQNNCHLLGM